MDLKLIIKKLKGSYLREEEEKRFRAWYDESPEHRSYFKNIKENYFEELEDLDVEASWHSLNKNLSRKSHKFDYWKYAVAAVLVGVFLTSYIFRQQLFVEANQNDVPVIVNNNIQPVINKAVLTLGDGSKVALEKGGRYRTKNFSSNGQEIVYQEEKTKKKPTYNYLTIPRGGQFVIQLSDSTKVWLNSETQLKYPTSFTDPKIREVELVYGEAYFEVSPSIKHNGATFKVLNNTQEVEVLGTKFNIKSYKDESKVYTTLVEGSVAVKTFVSHELLVPNQQSQVNKDNNKIGVSSINAANEIAWIDGDFFLQNKSFYEIMKVLSRWYDMDVKFENEGLKEVRLRGVIRKSQNITDILNTIKDFGILQNYEINNKTLILK